MLYSESEVSEPSESPLPESLSLLTDMEPSLACLPAASGNALELPVRFLLFERLFSCLDFDPLELDDSSLFPNFDNRLSKVKSPADFESLEPAPAPDLESLESFAAELEPDLAIAAGCTGRRSLLNE